ncbi:MAG: glycosyltransferase [Methanobrevibacter sp.]|nr:glycosyltransferase [Candidatus Methanoflexus mossambicus]
MTSILKKIKNQPYVSILLKSNIHIKETYRNLKAYPKIKSSKLFNEKYYIKNTPNLKNTPMNPIIHYLYYGYKENKNPSKKFNTKYYQNKYKKVKKSGINPLVHYLLWGKKEGKKIKYKRSKRKLKPPFTKFSGFLANSILSPIITAPFTEEEKRCFAVMDNITKYLINITNKSMHQPLVSVIMPTYNRAKIIQNAISSVLNQTYKNIELIIINDGSTDETSEILKKIKDERVLILNNDSNLGISKSRNIGVKNSNGEYIAYLDTDNEWDEKYIEAMIGAFIKLKDADMIYSGQYLYNKKGENPKEVRFGSFNKSLLINRNYIDLNCLCHTKKSFEELNGFDEDLKRLVDWDLIIRMSEKFKIYSIPVLLSKYYYKMTENRISDEIPLKANTTTIFEKRSKRINNKFSKILKSKQNLKKGISIIIPNYESLKDLKNCMNSIFSLNLKKFLEVIVIDNNSNEEVISYLKNLKKENYLDILIENRVNYGFTYAVNQGIKLSNKQNDILILNNDAILTPGALNSLQKYAYELNNCGITVPQQIISDPDKKIKSHVPYANFNVDCDINISIIYDNIKNVPTFHNGEILKLDFAPFFCTYIKREILEEMSLDPELGRHYRSDRVFSYYMEHLLNKNIYYISEAIVYHKNQQATTELKKDKKSYEIMFSKNQWEEELAEKLGYKKPIWDF